MDFGLTTEYLLGSGIYQAIRGNRQAKKYNAKLENALANSPVYSESPYATALLADTQGRTNATSPAVQAALRNANQQTVNQMFNAQRNASSGAEAIAAAATAQQQNNSVLPNLAAAQQAYDAQNRGAYYSALDNMTNERDKVFSDRIRRNVDMRNYFLGRTASANRNLQSGLNSIGAGLQNFSNDVDTAASMASGMPKGGGGAMMKSSTPGPAYAPSMNYMPEYNPYGGYYYNR